jgi:hypothetical protein
MLHIVYTASPALHLLQELFLTQLLPDRKLKVLQSRLFCPKDLLLHT